MPTLVPVDYDPFFDVAQQGPPDPNALVRLGPGGVTPAAAPNALQGALEAAYGLTGVPDLRAAYAAAARGEPLPALGQGAAGAAALIPALKPLALAPLMAAGIRSARPIANALGRAENALLPAGGEVNRAVNALTPSAGMKPIDLYHGTMAGDLADIKFGTHLGTRKAANERLETLINDPYEGQLTPEGEPLFPAERQAPTILPVTLNPKKVVTLPEMVDWNDFRNGNLIAKTLIKKGILKEDQIPEIMANHNGDYFEWLRSQGYDAVRYKNEYEDPGKYSYMVLNPEAVTNKLTGQTYANQLTQEPIRAYHGSPYDFDAFDASKIGTGEGAQAYGHGLYFAEHPETAKNYKDALANKSHASIYIDGRAVSLADASPAEVLAASVSESKTPLEDLAKSAPIGNYTQEAIEEAKRLITNNRVEFKPPGRMYEVNLNADPDTFLHWDKPLSEQPEVVRKAFEDPHQTLFKPEMSGVELYGLISRGQEAEASNGLRAAGINGIKYLDQGSRVTPAQLAQKEADVKRLQADFDKWHPTLPNIPGDEAYRETLVNSGRGALDRATKELEDLRNTPQTHNFVVFDPKIIEIIKKYGLAPLIAGGAFATGGDANAATHLVPVDHDPFKTEEP